MKDSRRTNWRERLANAVANSNRSTALQRQNETRYFARKDTPVRYAIARYSLQVATIPGVIALWWIIATTLTPFVVFFVVSVILGLAHLMIALSCLDELDTTFQESISDEDM